MSALLQATGLVRHFRSRPHPFAQERVVHAVDGVDLAIEAGETVAIVGESGCGKSTLARVLLRLIEPDRGRIAFEGQEITDLPSEAMRRLRARMQMIFQDPFASLNPHDRVSRIIGEPLAVHGKENRVARDARVAELLRIVGLLPEHAGRYPHEFSGGQRQRIGIARALASRPSLVIGDEPVSALDVSIQAQVINLLGELKDRFALTLIVISHDLAVVRHMSDRVAVMYLGQIVELGRTEDVLSAPRHPYTQALIAAIPARDPARRGARRLIGGDVPSPSNPPPGCRFHTRCPHARALCRETMPPLAETGGGHLAACHFWAEIAAAGTSAPSPAPLAPKAVERLAAWRRALATRAAREMAT